MRIQITVIGHPEPQGSTRAFMPRGAKHPVITSANPKMKPWRQQISGMAAKAMQGQDLATGAVQVTAYFYFARPKSLKKSVADKITRPDLDKLLRAVLDSLTGICYHDDGQVDAISAVKVFGSPERLELEVDTSGMRGGCR